MNIGTGLYTLSMGHTTILNSKLSYEKQALRDCGEWRPELPTTSHDTQNTATMKQKNENA